MPTTFAQTIDGNYIYAQRAVQDKNGDDIDQTYAKSSSLASVATSGAYSDLSGTPTIPSGSDLVPPYTLPTDEGKVLTVGPSTTYWSTPAAGGVTDVEVDGTSVVSQGVASITMPTVDQTYDGTSTNAQSGVAIAGEISSLAQVPTVTSSDDGKVLTADYTGGVASYSWETPSSTWPGLFEAEYNVTSYADITQAIAAKKVVYCKVPQSGSAARMAFLAYIGASTVEFQYYRSVSSKSATNQGDEVYVYTVNSSSTWSTTTRNCYTRITAGTNMSQTYSSGVLTLAADNQLPAATSSDEGKVLTIDSNGDPEWATGGGGGTQADWTESDSTAASYIENKPTPKTLTAGTGISITEDSSTITIANTAPDTVASLPTNLTAAQIQAFKEALGVDETVIMNTPQASSTEQMTVSEPFSNFEYIKVYAYWNYNSNQRIQAYNEFLGTQTIFSICGFSDANRASGQHASYFVSLDCSISGTTITVNKALRAQGDLTNPSVSDSLLIQRIVGVHRIASNNPDPVGSDIEEE